MSEKVVGEMEAADFEALLDDFNTRQAEQEGDLLSGEVFFQLWAEMESAASSSNDSWDDEDQCYAKRQNPLH